MSLWIVALLLLRFESFNDDGSRKKPLTETDDALRKDQIRGHNEGLYKDVDLFLKVSLALFGGIAFLAVSGGPGIRSAELRTEFTDLGFTLQLYTALFTAIFILIHKRSVILRWKNRFRSWEILLWGETWGVFFGMVFTLYAFHIVRPRIIKLIRSEKIEINIEQMRSHGLYRSVTWELPLIQITPRNGSNITHHGSA